MVAFSPAVARFGSLVVSGGETELPVTKYAVAAAPTMRISSGPRNFLSGGLRWARISASAQAGFGDRGSIAAMRTGLARSRQIPSQLGIWRIDLVAAYSV